MGNNFRKMMILHKGRYYEIDKKPEFHQAACKHKFIKAQIVKTIGDLFSVNIMENSLPIIEAARNIKSMEDTGTISALKDTVKILPIGRLPKKVNLCKKCGKVKVKNN